MDQSFLKPHILSRLIVNVSFCRFGMHENYDYYVNCKYRNRNKGLFTADQVSIKTFCMHFVVSD